MASAITRNEPNILITGTPGVGKSTLADKLAKRLNFSWLNLSQIARENDCISEYDDDGCGVLDEDKVLDYLEETMADGGKIVDYHGCNFFPERWFDLVIVLRTNNSKLYDRLAERGYAEEKLTQNLQCEIFQIISEEAHESYKKEIVHELYSNTKGDLRNNLKTVVNLVNKWRKENRDPAL